MKTTLYPPGTEPQALPLGTANPGQLLDCAPELVDILANGPGYVIYTVFDHEGPKNLEAMRVVAELTGTPFSPEDDDEVLRGPVLVVLTD